MLFIQLMPQAAYDWFFRLGFHYPAVLIFGSLAAFAYGSCLGSFINVCIWRMPRGESVVSAPSHCTVCGELIRWYDNLPVLSYLILRGRCRHCRTPYSPRYFIVEVLTGLLFIGVLLKSGMAQQPPAVMLPYCTMVLAAVAAAWIDAEHRIIPDQLNCTMAVIGIASAAVFPDIWGVESHLTGAIHSVAAGAVTGTLLAVFAVAGKKLFRREALGWGDVKYVAAIATLIGLPGALWTIFAGSWAGMIYGIIYAAIRKRPLKYTSIPFGPFLSAAALIWVFAGNWIIKLLID